MPGNAPFFMSFTVACVLRSGGVFDAAWVDRLRRQVDEHLQPDYFECLSDTEVSCGWLPLVHNWPGWWSKAELFRPGLFDGPVLYFDLDSVLVKPFDPTPLFCSDMLMMLDDFFCPQRPASGVMTWTPSETTERIYRDFAADPEAGMRTRYGDGGFIGQFRHDRLQRCLPGVFGSYKADRLQHGPRGFAHVSCHGRPKMHELPDGHWMHKAWIGESA